MRAYLRTSARTGLSLPWWLALPAMAVWLCLALLALVAMGLFALGVFAVRLVRSWRSPAD